MTKIEEGLFEEDKKPRCWKCGKEMDTLLAITKEGRRGNKK
jgi:hypothetical protein